MREAGGGSFLLLLLALSLWPEAARCFTLKQAACLTMTM
jgi:hypothetical protein